VLSLVTVPIENLQANKGGRMRKLMISGVAALLSVWAGSAYAQVTKTITGETRDLTATIEAIDSSNRSLSVKKPDGTYEVFYVPETFRQFETLKIGDKVTAKYYENMVLTLKAPGSPDINKSAGGVVRSENKSAGTVSHQRMITATITAIDPKAPSITFSGPNGWKYSSRVEDKNALSKVKVGDKVDITWTEAMVLSLERAK